MATVKNTITLQDKMSPVLGRIIKSMNSTLSALRSVDGASSKAFAKAQNDVRMADNELKKFNNDASILPPVASKGISMFSKLGQTMTSIAATMYVVKNIAEGVGKALEYTDNLTMMQARAKLVNQTFGTMENIQGEVFQAAQNARGDYGAMFANVNKLGILASEAFKNPKEIVDFTETLQKAFVVGGSSGQEQAAAMYQLTQAMAAGKLQGDEFRSIMENAPMLATAIAKSMGKSKGELKKMSAEGTITADVIKKSLFAATKEINANFNSMPKTFGQTMQQLKNITMVSMQPVADRISKIINSAKFQAIVTKLVKAIEKAAKVMVFLLDTATKVANWMIKNKAIVIAFITGISAALLVYLIPTMVAAAQAAYTMAAGFLAAAWPFILIAGLVAGAIILWNNFGLAGKVAAGAMTLLAAALVIWQVQQWAANGALYACPIVWIIVLIGVLIGFVYWFINVMNQAAGTTDSATGRIFGAFAVAFAIVANIVIMVWNLIVDIVQAITDAIAVLAEFLANVFNDPVGSVIKLFAGMADVVLGIIQALASAMDTLFGTNMAGGIKAFRKTTSDFYDKNLKDTKYKVDKPDLSAIRAQRFEYGKTYDAAYKAGQNVDTSAKNAMKQFQDFSKGNVPSNPTGGKIDEVGKIGDDVTISDEDIKLMKDIAAVEFVNKYTTLKPNMNVTFGDVHENADIDKILTVIEDMTEEALASSLVTK